MVSILDIGKLRPRALKGPAPVDVAHQETWEGIRCHQALQAQTPVEISKGRLCILPENHITSRPKWQPHEKGTGLSPHGLCHPGPPPRVMIL